MSNEVTGRSRSARFFTEGNARWVALAVALFTIVVLIVVFAVRGSDPVPVSSASPSMSPSASPSESPSASPSVSATPDTEETPDPAPAEPAPVAPEARPTKEPVPIQDDAQVKQGVTVTVSQLEAVQGTAQAPGDVAGPSVRVTFVVSNDSAATIDLSTAVTNMFFGTGRTPASELAGPGAQALPGNLAPGAKATGVSVFSIPESDRDSVTISFDYSVDVPIVVFTGAAPR